MNDDIGIDYISTDATLKETRRGGGISELGAVLVGPQVTIAALR